MKQRICLITHLNVQNENGPTLHVRGISDGMAKIDVCIDLICSGSNEDYHPNGELINLHDNQPYNILTHLRFQFLTLLFLAKRRGHYDWLYVRAGSFMLTPLYRLVSGSPVALEINGIPYLESKFSMPLSKIIKLLFDWQVRSASHCFVVTPELSKYANRLGQRHVHIIPNGVDKKIIQAANLNTGEKSGVKDLRLVFIGALYEWQGVSLAVEAVSRLIKNGHSVSFDILGDGPERDSIYELVLSLGLKDHVNLRGHVNRESVYEALRDANIAVAPFVPSRRNCAVGGLSPIKIYEYLAFNLPVVTTSLVSDDELFDNLPQSIRVVNPDANSISNAIVEISQSIPPRIPSSNWIAQNRTWDAAAFRTAIAMGIKGTS